MNHQKYLRLKGTYSEPQGSNPGHFSPPFSEIPSVGKEEMGQKKELNKRKEQKHIIPGRRAITNKKTKNHHLRSLKNKTGKNL